MKKSFKFVHKIFAVTCLVMCLTVNSFAHSGRTDSSGGHKDNKNKSGLGSYHYHCGGYPAHLHTNGVCPYSAPATTVEEPAVPTSAEPVKEEVEKPKVIVATSIEINEDVTEMTVEEELDLTATITPENTTNKDITWSSSDEEIATISSEGKLVAKSAGVVTITASTSNGKEDTLEINVKEIVVEEEIVEETENIVQNAVVVADEVTENTTTTTSSDDGGAVVGTLAVAGGAYWLYKKSKKGKE